MSYIGNSPGNASQRVVTQKVATAGQTRFASDSGYATGYVDVIVNGSDLVAGVDFNETGDGINIDLVEACAADDNVKIVAYIPRGLSDGYTKPEANALLALKADLVNGTVPSSQLPSYVDDVLEYATYSAFPTTGEAGKIYVDKSAVNKAYRWSGSAYILITDLSAYYTSASVDTLLASKVDKTANTGSLVLPHGSTAQRDSVPLNSYMRLNDTTGKLEYYNGSKWSIVKNDDTDPYWSSVKFYMRGGALLDLSGNHSISGVGLPSAVTAPGKPFTTALSESWYELNNTSSTTDYIEIFNTLDDFDPGQNTNWTVEFWLYKKAGYASYGHFFNIGGQDGQGVIKFAGDTAYGLYWYTSSGQTINFGAGSTFQAATWTWFVFEKQGSTLTSWRNGVRQSQNTNAFPAGSPSYMRLGYPYNGEYCPHFFDELRVTNVARYGGVATIPVQSNSWPTQG